MALRAYREYGRYLVELMRLPSMTPDEVGLLASDMDADEIKRIWRDAPGGGLIFAVGHVGNNEAVAAGIAHHGMPISVVADDSSFPELYELLRQQRESWGVRVIAWRNLREIFGVLKRREMLALLIDWGYRSDGIPVRLFGAWTTLPAGPATLAAKTGSRILPIAIRRAPTGGFEVRWAPPIDVAPNDPAALQRATQAMADALGKTIQTAPEQWYSFKPIWPAGAAEAADLERRAEVMLAGTARSGPRTRAAARRGRQRHRWWPGVTVRTRVLIAASWLACRLPEGPLVKLADLAGEVWYRLAPRRAAQARRNLARVCRALDASGQGAAAARAAAHDPRALERLVRARLPTSARATTSRSRGRRRSTRRIWPSGSSSRRPTSSTRPSRPAGPSSSSVSISAPSSSRRCSWRSGSAAPWRRWRRWTIRSSRHWFVRTRGAAGVRIVGLREARRELLTALRDGTSVGLVGDRDLTGGGLPVPLFGAPANLPLGPAMLAVESGAPLYVTGVRRTGIERYRGRLEAVARARRRIATRAGDRGDDRARRRVRAGRGRRARAMVGGLLPDLARSRGTAIAGRRHRRPRHDHRQRPARPRGPAHPHRGERRHRDRRVRSSTTSSGTRISTSSRITDHERIDAAVAARAMAADRGLRVEVIVGEEVTTLGGHLLALFIDRPIRPYRSLRATIAAVHERGGLAIPAHPLVPYPLCAQGWVLRRLLDDPDAAVRPDAIETFNPTTLGKPWHARVTRFADDHRPCPHRQQRRPRARGDRDRLDHVPGPRRGRPAPSHRSANDRTRRHLPPDGRAARHVRAADAQAGPRRTRRGAWPDPSRRHRPRPRLPGRPAAAATLRTRAGRAAGR